MLLTKLAAATLAVCCLVPPAFADSVELADLAARIEYGFYAGEPHVIDAARAALERLPADDANARYARAFAAFRSAQLAAARGADIGTLVEECSKLALPEEKDETSAAAEHWILLAACANLAHQRRRDQAMTRAREIDPDNPRIALLEAWSVSERPALAPAKVRDEAVAKLSAAVDAFGVWSAPPDAPEWGEAEALAALGEVYLQRGESRSARDLIERALLLAPDYRFAVELRGKVQSMR